jgi:hypothetical protein
MVRVWLAVLLVVSSVLGAGAARAQQQPQSQPPIARLAVDRSTGADSCPDADELKKQVEALAGEPILSRDGEPELELFVRVSPAHEGFRAEVTARGVRSGKRALEDSGPGCEGLGRGLAVILALMLDAPLGARPSPQQAEAGRSSPPPIRSPGPLYVLPEVPIVPEEKPAARFPPLMGSIGPAYVTGIVPSDAAAMVLAFEGYLPLVSFGASVVWIPHEERGVEQAEITYTYVGARTRACARQPDLEQYGLAACLRFGAGLRAAELSDKLNDVYDETDGAYVAFGGELEISRRIVGPFGVYADLGLDVAVVQDELALAAEDIRVAPDELGISFDSGVGIRFWLQPEKD